MIWLLVLVAGIEIGLPLLLWLGRNALLFQPSDQPRPEARRHVVEAAGGQLVWIVRPDGRELAAYDVAAAGLEPEAPVVLFFHGNAGNLAMRAEIAVRFASLARVRLLMFDYSGYGGNAGAPSEAELGIDALAAYDHLRSQGVQSSRIVLYGESLGGALALSLAAQRPVAGLVVQSTFSSLASIAVAKFPWLPLTGLLARGVFPSASHAASIDAPLLIVHGNQDRIVPFAESERLREAAGARAELLVIEGADHNDLFEVAGAAYLRDLGVRFRAWLPR